MSKKKLELYSRLTYLLYLRQFPFLADPFGVEVEIGKVRAKLLRVYSTPS